MGEAILPGSASGSTNTGPWKRISTYTNTSSLMQTTAMSDVWSYFYNNPYSIMKIEFKIAASFENGLYYANAVFRNVSQDDTVVHSKICEDDSLSAGTYNVFPCVMINAINDKGHRRLAVSMQSSYNPWNMTRVSYTLGTTSLFFSLGNNGANTGTVSHSSGILTVNIYGF